MVVDHLGQKFSCVLCEKEYFNDCDLMKHMKKAHDGMTKRKLMEIEKEMKGEDFKKARTACRL